MSRKSTAKTQDIGLPEIPKKRVRKTTTKSTIRATVTRRKKTKAEAEPPVVLRSPEQIEPTISPTNKERQVEVRRVDHMPMSPYVIEFRSEAETPLPRRPEVAPIVQVQSPALRHPEPTFTPDFSALEEFFNDTQTVKVVQETMPEPVSVPQPKPRRSQSSDHPRTPVLWPMITKSFAAFKTKTSRATSHFTFKAPSFAFSTPSRPLLRASATFAIIALIFTLPASGLQAYTKLEQTKAALVEKNREALSGFNLALNTPDALKAALGSARETFADTKNDLERAVGIFGAVLPFIPKAGSTFRSSTLLLDAGTHLTEAGRIIADGFTVIARNDLTLGDRLLHFEEALRAAFPLIQAAEAELGRTKPNSLPSRARGPITTLQALVPAVRAGFTQTLALLPALEDFLGAESPKRYLVVFQNPHELRATGGFIGSFALLDVDQGEITNLEVPGGGPYDLACCLTEHVIAPEPLHLIEPHWQFHDANWFPDFPTSAQKLMWFYGKSGGPSVDGVIAVNASLVPKLLGIVGPVELQEYDRTFTAENFIAETQKIVELEYDRTENKPKAVIGDLAPILIERLTTLPPEKLLSLVEVFASSLAEKDIQLFSMTSDTQTAFQEAGWAGAVKDTAHDYLMVVASNIAGGKSNASVETQIEHHATLDATGSVTDEVRITKTHTGVKGELFSGVRNVEYIRVYVPEGSTLVAASGFEAPPENLFTNPDADYKPDQDLQRLVKTTGVDTTSGTVITQEQGKTVFGNWMQTDPGATIVATITYRLPPPARKPEGVLNRFLGLSDRLPYTLLVQSQSGTAPQFTHQLIAPGLKKTWGASAISEPLTTDLFTAALFER